jgi:hypothetical protein
MHDLPPALRARVFLSFVASLKIGNCGFTGLFDTLLKGSAVGRSIASTSEGKATVRVGIRNFWAMGSSAAPRLS